MAGCPYMDIHVESNIAFSAAELFVESNMTQQVSLSQLTLQKLKATTHKKRPEVYSNRSELLLIENILLFEYRPKNLEKRRIFNERVRVRTKLHFPG